MTRAGLQDVVIQDCDFSSDARKEGADLYSACFLTRRISSPLAAARKI
jgi:hypothetical protein